jgi:hypothetical protein
MAYMTFGSRDGAVGIAAGYVLDGRGVGVRVPVGSRFFSSRRPTQLPIQLVPGALSLGVKRPGRDADHSPPTSAEMDLHIQSTGTTLPYT